MSTLSCRAPAGRTLTTQCRAGASGRTAAAPPPRRQQGVMSVAIGAAAAVIVGLPGAALASGIESVELPPLPEIPLLRENAENNAKKLAAADETFKNSPLLAELKERSVANKKKNADEIAEKYCKRQAELGIGDCGGLQYIPGYTSSGKQKTPMWLGKLLGMSEEEVNAYNSQIDKLPGTGISGYRN